MKKTVSLLLAVIFLISLLCACGDSTKQEETKDVTSAAAEATTAAAETTEPDKLLLADYRGRTCKILGVFESYEPSFEIAVEDMDGDALSNSVYKRNAMIEEAYGVKIKQVGNASASTTLEVDIAGGSVDYDIAFLYRDDMASAILKNLFNEISNTKYIDFSQDYYSEYTIESMKIQGKLYHMASDFSLVDKNRMAALFLNRDMAANYNIPDILTQVKEGSWTFDKFYTYVVQTSSDKNSDSKMSYTDDQFGVVIGSNDEAVIFWSAMGCKTVSADNSGALYFDYNSERSVAAEEKLKSVFSNTNYYFASAKSDNYTGAGETFRAGRALFWASTVGDLPGLAQETDFAYTALPHPKFDEDQQRYYTYSNNRYTATFGIPTCAADVDFSSFVIEALSKYSTETTLQTYYEINCKSKNSYDQECAEMLDLMFSSLDFDFGFMYDSALAAKGISPKTIVSGAVRGTGSTLTKSFSSYKNLQKKAIASLLDSLK